MESQTRAEKVAPQLSYMLFIWLNFCLVKLASFGVKIRASKTMKKQSQVSPHCLPWNRTLQLQVAWFGVKDEAEENPMEFRFFYRNTLIERNNGMPFFDERLCLCLVLVSLNIWSMGNHSLKCCSLFEYMINDMSLGFIHICEFVMLTL